MNRQNFLGHLALALTVILVAAFAGQLRRWERQRSRTHTNEMKTVLVAVPDSDEAVERRAPEVFVRFRKGVSEEAIDEITARLNDNIEDKIESVDGLVSIDDLDDADPQAVASEYRLMTELVEYAEPNFEINLQPRFEKFSNEPLPTEAEADGKRPDDPMFEEQWSLSNTGQRGGKLKADINALAAWEQKTTGSEEIVVAVLDSGVDYRHPDLKQNIWERPSDVDEYDDEQIGRVDDQYGYDAVLDSGDPMDDNGHGTHCAGIIGADGDNGLGIAGINWRVKIMPLKFISKTGSGTTKDAIEAINYV
ncbi:MAG: S8 family serine peptidase, partial [Pyrinomonadaceae bacterium]|nr:S8 family serine peptidase [Pyrinomonadaceae bacterium]